MSEYRNPRKNDTASLPQFDDAIFEALETRGFYVARNFVPEALREALYEEAKIYARTNGLRQAAVGRGAKRHVDTDLRSDKIRWLDATTKAQRQFLAWMEAYRMQLNRRFFLGLNEYEAHLATYEKGSFYTVHYDNFRARNDRIVTTVFYLNPEWDTRWGGELVVYDASMRELARIFPEPGTFVTFMSEELPHEVRPVRHGTRVSVAGWLRRDMHGL
jgi:SM-20-related protein